MRLSIRPTAWTLGVSGLLVAALGGMSLAADPESSAQNSSDTRTPNAAGQQNTQTLIGHAIGMAIESSNLHLIAQGSGADQNVRAAGQNQGSWSSRQLQEHARKGFQGSNELIRAAEVVVRSAGGNEAGGSAIQRYYSAADRYTNTLRALCGETPRMDETSRSSLENGRSAKANRELAGTGADQAPRANPARRSGLENDLPANQTARANDNPEPRQNPRRGQNRRTSAFHEPGASASNNVDAASVTLINHAVCEALDAAKLLQLSNKPQSPSDPAAQRLQEHARQMASESQETLQKFLAHQGASNSGFSGPNSNAAEARKSSPGTTASDSADEPGKAAQTAANANDQPGNTTSGQATGQQGRPSVLTLAQQARDVVQVLQQLSPQGSSSHEAGHETNSAEKPSR